MKSYSWTSKGWQKKEIEQSIVNGYKKRISRLYTTVAENNEANENTNVGIFALGNQINNSFEKESAIDSLPQNLRDIYQSNDRFFWGDYGMFHNIDPIEQVLLYHDWGTDKEDPLHDNNDIEDIDISPETIRKEKERIIENYISNGNTLSQMAEESSEEENIQSEILSEALDNEVISVSEEGEWCLDEHHSRDPNEGYNQPKQIVHGVDKAYYSIGAIMAEERKERFDKLFLDISLCKNKRQLYGITNDKIEESLCKIDGIDSAKLVRNQKEIICYVVSNLDVKSTLKELQSESLKQSILDYDTTNTGRTTNTSIYNIICETIDEFIYVESIPVYLDNDFFFIGGIMNKVHYHYNKDKELKSNWSLEEKQKQRFEFICKWRDDFNNGEKLKDEESLRKELYFRFDRAANETHDIVHNNKLIEKKKVTKACLWEQNKARTLNDLYLTSNQWKAIFKIKDVIVAQIEANNKTSEVRDQAIETLRIMFNEIKDKKELEEYIRLAKHREWNKESKTIGVYDETYISNGKEKVRTRKRVVQYPNYDFQPSLLDKISANDKFNWERSIVKLARKLKTNG